MKARATDRPLLTLDVSSSAAGWAVFLQGNPQDFGVIAPSSGARAIARIDLIVMRVRHLVVERRPDLVVMEWSAGHVHGRHRRKGKDGKPVGGNGAGLSVLGASQGAVRQMLRELLGSHRIETVGEDEWTGRKPKGVRAAEVSLLVPNYDDFRRRGRDPGLDAADALGLGFWHDARRREAALLARAAGKDS